MSAGLQKKTLGCNVITQQGSPTYKNDGRPKTLQISAAVEIIVLVLNLSHSINIWHYVLAQNGSPRRPTHKSQSSNMAL